MKIIWGISFFLISLIAGGNGFAQTKSNERILGQWKGVKMFQDDNTLNKKAYFLPNDGQMIITPDFVHLYYYPYFKTDKYPVRFEKSAIIYDINDKEIRCDYSFRGDTLIFEMTYIQKTFVKYFVPIELDENLVNDLDKYGFDTEKLTFEFELDTLNKIEEKGFIRHDSLTFEPYRHLEFTGKNTLKINRKQEVPYQRHYKNIVFSLNGKTDTLGIQLLSGTQSIFIVPSNKLPMRDSIVLPYMTVIWADRGAQAIIDEENF